MLTEVSQIIKAWARTRRGDAIATVIIVGVAAASFGLGRLSATWSSNGEAKNSPNSNTAKVLRVTDASTTPEAPSRSNSGASTTSVKGDVVASKNGTTYYLVSCAAAKRIKESNRIYFISPDDARRAGYTPASNCPGLVP